MTPELSIITCTGDRQLAFDLCARYVFRQEGLERVQWVVVDDGDCHVETLKSVVDAPDWLRVDVVRLQPGKDAAKSFRCNMMVALNKAEAERIIFMEDDEWYARGYALSMFKRLAKLELAGEGNAVYYNVRARLYRRWGNSRHASMCQTGIKGRARKQLMKLLRGKGTVMVDRILWGKKIKKRVFPSTGQCVSMKGMPGRSGIGVGHRPRKQQYNRDPDGTFLKRIVGADAKVYLELHNPKKAKVR